MNDQIYPIALPQYSTKALVMKYLRKEWDEADHRDNAEYFFDGRVMEHGGVHVYVRYTFDHDYVAGSGTVLSATIHPFDAEALNALRRDKIMMLAAAEYENRRRAKEDHEIRNIAIAMFGDIGEIE